MAGPVTVPLHLGALHPYEQLLVLVIAFGPFVVLLAVVRHRRRQDIAAEQAEAATTDESAPR